MIKRRKLALRPIPKMLIVCEGKLTERIYFEGIRRLRRIPRELVTLECAAGVPRSLVDRAAILKQSNLEASNGDATLLYDQVWCVFDRDDHPNIAEAKQKAKAHELKIAFSNPSFELFLLLHCADCNQDLHRDVVRNLLKRHFPDYDKAFDYNKIHDLYPQARRRAGEINKRATLVKQIESAPFCSVPALVDQLRHGM